MSYPSQVIADGAVAYWRLNEASGTVATDSVGTAHGTISATGVTYGVAGPLSDGSTALQFNGSTGDIDIPNGPSVNFGTGPVTIECWMKRAGVPGSIELLIDQKFNGDSSYPGVTLWMDPSVLTFMVGPGSGGPQTQAPVTVGTVTDGAWHHLVGVVERGTSDTVRLYVDGVAVPSYPTSAPGWNLNGLSTTRIGTYPTNTGTAYRYAGALDEIAFYKVALTPAQVAAHYALRLFIPGAEPTPLVTPSLDVQLEPDVWTPLIADVVASAGIRATRGIPGSGPLDRVAMPGVLTFTLRNDGGNTGRTVGWYSPDHSQVRPGWTAGIPVRLGLVHAEIDTPIWTGRIRTIAPEPGRHLSRYVEVTAQDAIADLTETIVRSIPPQVNQTEDDLLTAVVAAMPTSVQPPLALDPGLDELPYVFDDIGEGASALQLVSDVMLSSFGTLFVAPDGTLTYRNRQTQSRQTSSDTFTEDDLITDGGLVLQSGLGSVYNRVRATVHPRTLGATATDILYAVTGTILVAPGETVTIWGSYADQSHIIRTIGGVDFQVPLTAGTDYAANSAPGGGGSNLTGALTVVATPFASSVRFDVTNTGGTPAYLVTAAGVPKLQIRGRAIYDNAPVTVEKVNPQPYGDRLLNLDLKYQDDVEVAQGMVDLLQSLYQDPRNRVVRVGIHAQHSSRHLAAALEREVGDVLTISEPVTGISSALLTIRGVEWDIQIARPALVRAWWSMAPSLSLTGEQWILNDAIFSILDETTILGVA